MSLINDALKRAKDAQQKSPAAAPGPQLRPAEPAAAVAPTRGMGMTAPVIVILIVLGGGVFLWLGRRQPVAPASPVVQAKPAVQPVAVSIPSAVANPLPATPPPIPAVASMPASIPAMLKLQAIFFVPGHSSAIINGKTVRAGDKVLGFRVAVIDQNSATLVSTTQTNVMTLEQ